MRKKFIYCGLLLVVIAVIAFFAASYALSGSIFHSLPAENITVPNGGSSYALINTSDAATTIVSAVLSSAANIYIFNASDFNLWQRHVAGNVSVDGLRYAQALYHGNSSFIRANNPLMMPVNASAVLPKSELYNNSIYVVIDNTNGSASSNRTVDARVVYMVLDSATTAKYRSLASEQLYAGFAAFVLLLAGIAMAIFGAIKKDVHSPDAQVPTSKNEANKDYIDSLYENINKRKRRDNGGQ